MSTPSELLQLAPYESLERPTPETASAAILVEHLSRSYEARSARSAERARQLRRVHVQLRLHGASLFWGSAMTVTLVLTMLATIASDWSVLVTLLVGIPLSLLAVGLYFWGIPLLKVGWALYALVRALP